MSTERFKSSFSSRLRRSFTLGIVIMSVVFTAFFVYYQTSAAREGLISDGTMFADLLAKNTSTWVFAENRDMIRASVQGVVGLKDVVRVTVYSSSNGLIYDEMKDARLKTVPEGDKEIVDKVIREGVASFVERESSMEFFCPVVLESFSTIDDVLLSENAGTKSKTVTGCVKVVLGKDSLVKAAKTIVLRSLIIALVFLLSGIAFINAAIRRVTRPLNNLTEAVRLFGREGDVGKVPVESEDEVGRLAMTFNNMSDSLNRREEEKQLLHEKLRQAQKLEAVGTFARGIAHDFNNILSSAQGAVYILDKQLSGANFLRQYTNQINVSIAKAKNLVQGLHSFSRAQEIRYVAVEVNALLERSRAILSNIAGEDVEIVIRPSETELTVMADPMQLEQVLMNLCSNARDAMPDGGRLEIRAMRSRTEELKPEMDHGLEYACIAVADDGVGMPRETRERMFDPFFTTKEAGKGTGLGLSIVYGIIEQHKGYVTVQTAEGEGTVFRVYLPLAEDAERCDGAEGPEKPKEERVS